MEGSRHILIVEDEKDLADLISYNLRKAGHQTTTTYSGLLALKTITDRSPDLVVLDLMIPDISGTEVAARLRANPATAALPIIMVTAKASETDQLVGLTVGADDYITKPFSMKVLVARVAALLRRTTRAVEQQEGMRLGGIRIDMQTHEAFVDDVPIKLTLTEFRILSSLLAAGGRVLSRAVLMAQAMGPGVTVTDRTIDVHVTAIRKKLGEYASAIRTVRGVGYRAALDESDAAQVE